MNYYYIKNYIFTKLEKNDNMIYENDISYYIKHYNPLYNCIISNIKYMKFSQDIDLNSDFILVVSDSLFYYIKNEGLEIKILSELETSEIITIPEKNIEILSKNLSLHFRIATTDSFRIFLSDKKEIAKLKLKM